MKNILKLITPLLAMLVLLTACSSEKIKVYTKSVDNQDLQVTIYYKGDSVKIIKTGDRNYGKFGVVQGIKTAMEDKWVLVQIDGEQEYYQIGELILGTPAEKGAEADV